ncbi:dTMP kinase [Candidatus Thorarchaeota archaeon]|nr:MAG: dTMP kinase [Candidatus Thorarchaeota archaeon]
MNKRHHERKGFLFLLEGIDGSGKSSACIQLSLILEEEGYDVVHLREPTNESPWGKEIRARSPRGELTPKEELDLFMKDRDWHIQNRILPALDEGNIVLLDRYFFATGAYQSEATGIPWREILRMNRDDINAPEPDIVFILDIDAETGLARATGRENKANLQFEKLERLVKVRQTYLEISSEDIGDFKVIDASRSLEEVVNEVYNEIIQRIKCRDNLS